MEKVTFSPSGYDDRIFSEDEDDAEDDDVIDVEAAPKVTFVKPGYSEKVFEE